VDIPHHLGQKRMLLQQSGPIPLLEQVTVLPQLAIHVSSMLPGQPLHQAAQWLIRDLKREVHLTNQEDQSC